MAAPHSPNPPHRKLRWYQFSMKTLMLFVLMASFLMSWVAVKARRIREQRAAVAMVRAMGGAILYDYQLRDYDDDKGPPPPPGPAWLRELLGQDIFADVVEVNCRDADIVRVIDRFPHVGRLDLSSSTITDDDLRRLKGLKELYGLDLSRTSVTDAGLVHLEGLGLENLDWLALRNTKVTAAGVARLKKKLHTRIIVRDGE
jgi:hypothetical protein